MDFYNFSEDSLYHIFFLHDILSPENSQKLCISKRQEVFTKMTIQNPLGYIKGITFAPFHKRGSLSAQTARDSFDYMIEHTAADFVILAPVGLQDHAHSEEME